ncbi:ELMO domain-containing protein 1 [Balamuthia mandrillaris]
MKALGGGKSDTHGTAKLTVRSATSGATLHDFEFRKDQPLAPQLHNICQQLHAEGEPSRYALLIEPACTYVPQEGPYALSDGTNVRLVLKPDLVALDTVQKLSSSDSEVKRKALTLMKAQLKDDEFVRKFIEVNGLMVLSRYLQEISGNLLGFALTTLKTLMDYGLGWEKLDDSFLRVITSFISCSNLTASRRAIEILNRMAQSERYGFKAVDSAIREQAKNESKKPYYDLIQIMASTDLNMKEASLKLIVTLITSLANATEKKAFLHMLDELDINKLLKEQVTNIENKAFKEQLYLYQRSRLWELKQLSDQPYDKTNSEHEQLLLHLWEAVFPDVKLENRISAQWKRMGFQGTDPATDFRGMGLLGLKNLIYIAENQQNFRRKIVDIQHERKDHDYPVAVAGINLTQVLCELLHIGKEDPNQQIFNILFDHPHAFEEIYCIAFQVLDHTWDDMNASYMDFPKVMAAVRKQIGDVLAQNPATVEMFQRVASWKQSGLHGEDDTAVTINGEANSATNPLNKLRHNVRKAMLELVKSQKLSYLRDGCAFKVYSNKLKGKAVQQLYFFRLSENHKELLYGPITNGDVDSVPELTESIIQSEVRNVVTGMSCPVFANQKKLKPEDEEIIHLTFSLTLTGTGDAGPSGSDSTNKNSRSLTIVSLNPFNFVNWTDGLRVWIGHNIECNETLDDLKTLVDTEIEVCLLDLEGANIPSTPPPVPPPPSNYDFLAKDQSEMSNQPTQAQQAQAAALQSSASSSSSPSSSTASSSSPSSSSSSSVPSPTLFGSTGGIGGGSSFGSSSPQVSARTGALRRSGAIQMGRSRVQAATTSGGERP